MTPATAIPAADIMKTLAHELRQPLGAIESIAYYLSMILPQGDPKVGEQLDRLQEMVEQSDWILANVLYLAGDLQISLEMVDVDAIIREFIESRSWNRAPALELGGCMVRADANLQRALIANLITLVHQSDSVVRTLDHMLEFESAATSLGPGGQLSVESARRIVVAHGGSLDARVDAGGIRIRVMLT